MVLRSDRRWPDLTDEQLDAILVGLREDDPDGMFSISMQRVMEQLLRDRADLRTDNDHLWSIVRENESLTEEVKRLRADLEQSLHDHVSTASDHVATTREVERLQANPDIDRLRQAWAAVKIEADLATFAAKISDGVGRPLTREEQMSFIAGHAAGYGRASAEVKRLRDLPGDVACE